jgi:hypothetical protein
MAYRWLTVGIYFKQEFRDEVTYFVNCDDKNPVPYIVYHLNNLTNILDERHLVR